MGFQTSLSYNEVFVQTQQFDSLKQTSFQRYLFHMNFAPWTSNKLEIHSIKQQIQVLIAK